MGTLSDTSIDSQQSTKPSLSDTLSRVAHKNGSRFMVNNIPIFSLHFTSPEELKLSTDYAASINNMVELLETYNSVVAKEKRIYNSLKHKSDQLVDMLKEINAYNETLRQEISNLKDA